MNLQRIAAFSDQGKGGNPAGVVIGENMPDESEMRRVAADVGYSETVFAAPEGEAWRVRYFSPESEVPFCGHATIALGAALAAANGDGVYPLILNAAEISVEGWREGESWRAALQSPPTHSKPMSDALLSEVLELFGYSCDDLDPALPPAHSHAGANHLVLALKQRDTLARLDYDLDVGRRLMRREDLITILFAWVDNHQFFHTRNPFASGGVYEDPATGAATAAFAGYLRDRQWPHAGSIEILQGEDMGQPSRLFAEIPDTPGSSIRVAGATRPL